MAAAGKLRREVARLREQLGDALGRIDQLEQAVAAGRKALAPAKKAAPAAARKSSE